MTKVPQLDSELELQIAQCLALVKDVLSDDLLGMYLYGSALLGGLVWKGQQKERFTR